MSEPPSVRAALTTAAEVAEHMASRAEEADRLGRCCVEDLEELKSKGLLGFLVPRRLGGIGGSFSDYVELAMILGKGSGSSALIYNMHASVTGALALTPDPLVAALGAGEDYFAARDSILFSAARGSLYAVAMSERGAGSRLSELTTTYRATNTGFHLVGKKAFVSGASAADAFLVAARSQSDASTVSFFLVPAGEGIDISPSWDALGMRASGSDDVSFDLELAPATLIGGREGLVLLVASIMPQWLVASYAAVYVGVARAALEAAAAHCKSRGLDRLSSVRQRLGRGDAAVFSATASVREAARLIDSEPATRQANRAVYAAKLIAGDAALEVASSALEAAGASALRRGSPLERLYRDARCAALQPATSDVCADWLGVAALGGDPDHDSDVPRW